MNQPEQLYYQSEEEQEFEWEFEEEEDEEEEDQPIYLVTEYQPNSRLRFSSPSVQASTTLWFFGSCVID